MRILVYDDNPDFGGHQIMACRGIEALANDPTIELVFMVNPANQKLSKRLGRFQLLEPTSDFHSLHLDLVLCIQGDIKQSLNGVRAANRCGIECVSYIAIPHRMTDMGAKFGALRDLLNQGHINRPDRFITLSESMAHILAERGCTKPITIVPNGIPAQPVSKHQTSSSTVLGLMGRIEFNQKQQDFMVRSFLEHSELFDNCRLLLVGSGPDEKTLRQLIADKDNITLMPWQDNPETFYEQIDFLVLPSRFEGVPLVMLEALARGIPVIGSARDGMKDLLPSSWTFEPENSKALAHTFSTIQKTWQETMPTLQQKVLTEHTLDLFKANFVKAIKNSAA